MADPVALLDTLENLGVRVSLTPAGRIQVEPASKVPAEVKAMVIANRAGVIEHLFAHKGSKETKKTPETKKTSTRPASPRRGFSGVSGVSQPNNPGNPPASELLASAAARPDLFLPLGISCWTCSRWRPDAAHPAGDVGRCTAPASDFAEYQQPGLTQAKCSCYGDGWRANPEVLPVYQDEVAS